MNIARLKEEYQKTGCPIISMDSKKKEDIGNFFRAGSLYTQKEICVYDHDFTSFKGNSAWYLRYNPKHGLYLSGDEPGYE
jgi:hypothetical protein